MKNDIYVHGIIGRCAEYEREDLYIGEYPRRKCECEGSMLAAMDTMDERTKIRGTVKEEITVSSSSTKRRKVDDSDELLILNLVENSASASTADSTMSSSSSSFSFFVEELSDVKKENMRSTDLKVKLKFKILLHRRLFRLRKSENFNAP